MKIERATLQHLQAITDIYNDAIAKTTATFDTTPKSLDEQRRWFEHHSDKLPVFVALDGGVLGWASLSAWSDRCAYSETAEISVYVSEAARGRGVGKALLAMLITHAREVGHHTLLARVVDGNAVSLALHEHAGFVKLGTMREVGKKFGKRLDVHLLQRMVTT